MNIKRQYIIDEQNRKVAVQLDIKTFEQIEEVLENHALFCLMENTDRDETLDLKEAQNFYANLKKSDANRI